jgi:hypothetical protein
MYMEGPSGLIGERLGTTPSEHPNGWDHDACPDYREAARPDVRDGHLRPDPDEVGQEIAANDHLDMPEDD